MAGIDIINAIDEIIDPMDLLTSNEILDEIKIFDSTVEIVGYVDKIESHCLGRNRSNKLLKFCLNNGTGRRVQVMVWNHYIDKIVDLISPNAIIHLDGAHARIPKYYKYNIGNVIYELSIESNTKVYNIGKYEHFRIPVNPESIQLYNILNCTAEYIIIQAYIKTNFANIFDNKLRMTIGAGAITDGVYKLQVQIINFNYNEYCNLNINKGDKVEIIGKIYAEGNPPYLIVNKITEIKKLDGYVPFSKSLYATKTPKKRKLENASSEENKRICVNNIPDSKILAIWGQIGSKLHQILATKP